jgi:adenylylsulfate kinase
LRRLAQPFSVFGQPGFTWAAVAVVHPAVVKGTSNRDMVIWVTGLSGSGKSTLCDALRPRLKALRPALVVLDGDVIRAAFGGDLDFHEADRVRQIKRIQGIAKVLADQDITVLVAALYCHPDLLAWNREHLRGYFEVYVKADVEFLAGRDGKQLYGRARRGEMKNVVGVDIPWHAPKSPEMVIEAAAMTPPQVLADQVLARVMATADRAAGYQVAAQ